MRKLLSVIAAVLSTAALSVGPAGADPQFVVIHTFSNGSPDGWLPSGALAMGESGEIYGTTQRGGTICPTTEYSCGGTVYRLARPAAGKNVWQYKLLASFGTDGASPVSGLTLQKANGIFYGSTEYGGDTGCSFEPHHWGCGTVFELKPPSASHPKWQKVILHRFSGDTDGRLPTSAPILVGPAAISGTTAQGGKFGGGMAYRVTFTSAATGTAAGPPAKGWRYNENEEQWYPVTTTGDLPEDLLDCGANSHPEGEGGECICDDGSDPDDQPLEGCGPTDNETLALGSHHALPLILMSPGSLFGVTREGGDDACVGSSNLGCGVVFQMKPAREGKYTYHVLYSFLGDSDGYEPIGTLTKTPEGVLYGTTLWGGTSCPVKADKGCGTVFRLTPPKRRGDAWQETILHRFAGGSDGAIPAGGVMLGAGGALYGATSYGGGCTSDTRGCGTIFKLSRPAHPNGLWRETILHSFENGADGKNPDGALIRDSAGHVYGTALNVLFQIIP